MSSKQTNCKLRLRDIVVGGIACLLFGAAAHYLGQQQVLATLASINFGFVAALASMHLWSPLVITNNPPPSD